MFLSGGFSILLAGLFLSLIAVLIFSRKLKWFARLHSDTRSEGRRTRVFAPLVSLLVPSLVLSLVMYLLDAIFRAALGTSTGARHSIVMPRISTQILP
jgi:TRAP-type mannitol/chloroaromatic compound transport system permease large subunit